MKAALEQFPRKLHAIALRRAVAAGAIVIRDDARSRVPILKKPDKRRKPGTLRNAIRVGRSKLDSSRVQETYNVYVNVLSKGVIRRFKQRTGKSSRDNPNDAYYWKVWEFGNGVNNTHPFLRPAFDARWRDAASVIASTLRANIGRVVESLRWKTSRG
jgi:HK97 gp10 family phage protein